MFKKVKKTIRNSPRLMDVYKKAMFFKKAPLKDLFNFSKLSLFLKVLPYTMVSYKALSNVYELSKTIEKKSIKGAFVECGTWKGGCSAVMAHISRKSNRKTWLFDSFEGLPEPVDKDGQKAKELAAGKTSGDLSSINECVASVQDVEQVLFSVLKIDPNNIKIKKGWFQNTLPIEKNKVGEIAILRLDGDWYESTKSCLENLYDQVISGGYVIFDDYNYYEGCQKALDEFVEKRNLKIKLIKIDDTGVYFQKP